MAFVASAVGKVIVKLVVGVLSAPKSNTAIAALVVELYINAPLQVKFAGFQTALAKEMYAVCPLVAGGTTVRTSPVAVYPVPTISLSLV